MTHQDRGGPRLVVVEDQADSREALARLLAYSGYSVRSASCVSDALEVVRRHGCDLLIADLGLPDGSGLELPRRLRTDGTMPAIALTGYTSPEDAKRCADAGFLTFLPKPVDYATLAAEVGRIVGRGEAARETDGAVVRVPA